MVLFHVERIRRTPHEKKTKKKKMRGDANSEQQQQECQDQRHEKKMYDLTVS